MTALQWVGIGFAAALFVFLGLTFFLKDRLSDDQRTLLRFFCALCAGFAGGLFTGEALFKAESKTGLEWVVSGTAGFALFFLIWLTFPKVSRPPDAFHFTIPKGWSFKQAVEAVVGVDQATADYDGFTADELKAPLQERELRTESPSDALRSLRLLTISATVRPYDVRFQPPTYFLKVKP